MTVCFDVDGTLINLGGTPRHEVIELFEDFAEMGADVYVWSGGGIDYAKQKVRELGLEGTVRVIRKGAIKPDIAIDDMDVTLGKFNLKV